MLCEDWTKRDPQFIMSENQNELKIQWEVLDVATLSIEKAEVTDEGSDFCSFFLVGLFFLKVF